MNYIDHTLSNIVLPKGAEPLGGWDLYIKTPEGSVCAPETVSYTHLTLPTT